MMMILEHCGKTTGNGNRNVYDSVVLLCRKFTVNSVLSYVVFLYCQKLSILIPFNVCFFV